ncbi:MULTISPECIES: hypothetical protein [unclassified Paraburkholderia]|uniref:hypothetical protein n=1 Tax=unclassified Paraburkholderia TaxID=2615204 RepID=UPI0016151C93|nr:MULTISPECIES: hypothetical protein [unclassified Paraburkholderia]MBB5442949.1 hypothetical protein [Paraburkholderia sp. WSM4177]MBB5483446.1 hypothetical protein [Paraburkholderia sp. WSM4180]
MQANQTPTLVPLPFATNGLRNVIPEASQAGVTPGAASFNDGFPPVTMQPKTQGGVPPDGKDFNGILYDLSQTVRWVQAGGQFVYSAPFATDPNVSGYPQGAVLVRADYSGFWFNEADNNTTNPDATDGSARSWVSLNADWNAAGGPGQILHRPPLATVATTGSYDDLLNRPTMPPGQVNSDWNASSGVAAILNKPAIQPPLGFTPVQQGGGAGQGNNKLYLGWDGSGHILGQIDNNSSFGALAWLADVNAAVGGAWTTNNLQPLTVNGLGYVAFIVKNGDSSQSASEGTVMGLPGRPGSWLSSGSAAAASDYWCVWTRIA